MKTKSILSLMLIFFAASATYGQKPDSQSAVILDENLWVTFYDLPSRRFRAIRAAVLTRDNASAARDLPLAQNHSSVEAEGSSVVFHAPLEDLRDLAGDFGDPKTPARAYRERPIVRADKLLRKIGKQIDRRVLLSVISE